MGNFVLRSGTLSLIAKHFKNDYAENHAAFHSLEE